jgi:hypothetical protein
MISDQLNPINSRRLHRVLWALIGASLFFWIGYEDRSTFIPVLLGGMIAAAMSVDLGRVMLSGKIAWMRKKTGRVLVGLIAGTLAMPLAALAILVKISLHGHEPSDFTLAQVLAVLGRTPIWAGAGTLIGISAAIWRPIRRD